MTCDALSSERSRLLALAACGAGARHGCACLPAQATLAGPRVRGHTLLTSPAVRAVRAVLRRPAGKRIQALVDSVTKRGRFK